MEQSQTSRSPSSNLMMRLLKDKSGNTLALFAAAILPLMAMIGAAVDMSRAYLVTSRLQQACDAGVLAARKGMGSSVTTSGALPGAIEAHAQKFFNLNFRNGNYATNTRTFSMVVENDLTVVGTATINVPTTMMSIFQYNNIPVSVECKATINMGAVDIMMVLDVTGSMAWDTPDATQSRIAAMRTVIKNFHTQVEDNKGSTTETRYGFVPYAVNVNTAHLLNNAWVQNQWDYQSRTPKNLKVWGWVKNKWGWWTWKRANVKGWNYAQRQIAAGNWRASTDGCMEERDTYNITDYDNVDLTKARDLDIDLLPSASTPGSRWRARLTDEVYSRKATAKPAGGNGYEVTGSLSTAAIDSTQEFFKSSDGLGSTCPTALAQLVQPMTATEMDTYLSTLSPDGGTSHDIGMIWGARLLSPTGIFAAHNADDSAPRSRHMIFLTDGQTDVGTATYGPYGIEAIDQRRWTMPSGAEWWKSQPTLNNTIDQRFLYACNQAKARNITMWVIAFGTSLNTSMTECAGPGHHFEASDSTELNDAFTVIANTVGDLRLKK